MGRFLPNPAAVKEIVVSPEMAAALRTKAEQVAQEARLIAPVATGAYRDSIRADGGVGEAQVTAGGDGVDYALYLEYGTSDTPAFSTLRRALEGVRE